MILMMTFVHLDLTVTFYNVDIGKNLTSWYLTKTIL